MTFQERVERAFLDEMSKIASVGGLASKKLLGATMGTWGKRALVGAVPGAVAGMAASEPGGGLGGAIKGGLIGGAAGALGGGVLQHQALSKIPGFAGVGYAGLKDAGKMRALLKNPEARKAYMAATRSTLPGVV